LGYSGPGGLASDARLLASILVDNPATLYGW
jgi:hypothetical protein